MNEKKMRRFVVFAFIVISVSFYSAWNSDNSNQEPWTGDEKQSLRIENYDSPKAINELNKLEIKGRSPKTGYSRSQFSSGWANIDGCDARNLVLQRDLADKKLADDGCIVLSGKLNDPYTGKEILFLRGPNTSSAVQIDHVVALSDAWQKGAQFISASERLRLANDSLNLLAVDGPINMKKSDGDAATWLPPNKGYRCQYVARQVAVKVKYKLWVTKPEHDAISKILASCPEQRVPITDQ